MRTIIRMQRKGPKNLYTNRMVVQGSYKKLKGIVIENLGFWVYKKLDAHKKSLILNRNRARYWLAMGALLSPKIQRFFCAFNLACSPYIKWGKATAVTYKADQEKAFRLGVQEYLSFGKPTYLGNQISDGKSKAVSARNVYFRQFKFREQLKNYLEPQHGQEYLDSIIGMTSKEVTSDTPLERSQKFYELKRLYEEIEKDPTLIAPYKRELLYNRMNELAEQGLMSESEVESTNQKLKVSDKLDPVERAFLAEWEERKERTKQLLTTMETMLNPIDKTEFVARAKEQSSMSNNLFEMYMGQYLSEQRDRKEAFTLVDVEYFAKVYCGINNAVDFNEGFPETNDEHIFVAPQVPITPEPDIALYDPNDWYDMREATTNEIRGYASNKDRWFDLPMTEASRAKTAKAMTDMYSTMFRDAPIENRIMPPQHHEKVERRREVMKSIRDKRAAKKAEKERSKQDSEAAAKPAE